MNIQSFHHFCIQTNHYQASLAFYTQVFGFKLIKETPNFHGRSYNTWLKLNDFFIELQTGKQGKALDSYNKESEGIVHLCFITDNLDAEYERLKKIENIQFLPKKGSVIYSVEGGRLLKLAAPEGTIIELRDSAVL